MSYGLLWVVLLAACGRGPQVYGETVDAVELSESATAVDQVRDGVEVTVSGVVGEVCPMGCWFYLLGDASMVYVELDLGSGFVIPKDSTKRKAVVRGQLVGEGAQRRLKARTVLLYSR